MAPIRLADNLALDFLNTIATPRNEPVEWLTDGEALVDWLAGAGLIHREQAVWPEGTLDEVARKAIELREWFRTWIENRGRRSRSLSAAAQRLNGWMEKGESYRRMDGERVVTVRRWREPEALLAPIAEAMAELITEGEMELVRKCENPGCTLWFYDRTKGHRRRWCSQAACGNRAKVAAFRKRKRAGTDIVDGTGSV